MQNTAANRTSATSNGHISFITWTRYIHSLALIAMIIILYFLLSDKCVEVIIDAGEVLNVARSWLERTESSTQLQKANAALIIANMARSGMSCNN